MAPSPLPADRARHVSLFLLSLTILAYQVLLARMFGVAISSLSALTALAVSMFGLAFGALLYHRASARMAGGVPWHYVGYGAGMLLQVGLFLALPKWVPDAYAEAVQQATALAAIVPCAFAGMALAELLFYSPAKLSRRYAADLLGAATGCLVISGLQQGMGPTHIALALSGVVCLAMLLTKRPRPIKAALCWLACAACYVGALLGAPATLEMNVLHTQNAPKTLYEAWNDFSYVRVQPYEKVSRAMAHLTPEKKPPGFEQLYIDIDGQMGTLLTHYGDSLANLDYLKHEVSNAGLVARSPKNLLLIGFGGGIDVLSALAFKVPNITGLELNPIVFDLVTGHYADYVGHLDKHPGVTLLRAEGRSWLQASPQTFDQIRMAIVPVWAAGAAVANTIVQNKLLTVEAWSEMFGKLTPNGMLSVTRTMFRNELQRLVQLSISTLVRAGVPPAECRNHIFVIINDIRVTTLVSVSPFNEAELARLDAYAKRTGSKVMLSPHVGWQETTVAQALHAAPSDDAPFYRTHLDWNLLSKTLLGQAGFQPFMLYAVFPLSFFSFVLYVAVTFFPGVLTRAHFTQANAKLPLAAIAYFTCTAGGFMLVEVMLMYQIMIFMPEPSDALSVVLFTLLLSGGAGSYASQRLPALLRHAQWLLPCALLATAALYPYIADAASGATALLRVAYVAGLLAPAGFFMGITLPAGMQRFWPQTHIPGSWLFAINCAFSACMSSVALILAASASISATYLLGVAFYMVSAALYFTRPHPAN